MTSGVPIDQRTEADLVGDAGAGESFGDDADDNAQHGGAAIEQLSLFELLHVDLGFAAGEIMISRGVGHDLGWG